MFPSCKERGTLTMLPDVRDYDELCRAFRWQVPARYNIGIDVCDRWAAADPRRLAILHVHPDGRADEISYGWLKDTSDRLANVLTAHGIARGDCVAILLPQVPEVAAAHVAVYKAGAVALPLAVLFGVDALTYRLQNSGAKAVVTNAQGAAKVAELRDQVPGLGWCSRSMARPTAPSASTRRSRAPRPPSPRSQPRPMIPR